MELSTYFEPIDIETVGFQSQEFRPMLGDDIMAYTERGHFPNVSEAH